MYFLKIIYIFLKIIYTHFFLMNDWTDDPAVNHCTTPFSKLESPTLSLVSKLKEENRVLTLTVV